MISDDLLNELHVVETLELNLHFYEQHSVFFLYEIFIVFCVIFFYKKFYLVMLSFSFFFIKDT